LEEISMAPTLKARPEFWPPTPESKMVQAEVPEQLVRELSETNRRFHYAARIVVAGHSDTKRLAGITTALDMAMIRMPVLWQRQRNKLSAASELLDKIEQDIQRLSASVRAFQELMGTRPKKEQSRTTGPASPKAESPGESSEESGEGRVAA
jgi:hypothetical protein